MSEEEKGAPEVSEPLRPTPPTEDCMLEELVRFANYAEDDFELPITLMGNGGIITGSLIGLRRYFREYSLLWRTEEAPEIEAMWVERGEKWVEEMKANEEVHFNFIHLRSARFAGGVGGLYPKNSGCLWRGRLSHVTGFAVGALTDSKSTFTTTTKILSTTDAQS